ncbi:DUF551 domain-containing protein [Escherichia coli]|nr:DUF551 domain-containing protein [Escherichia coli]MBC0314158.1 DUF551 domain-containing protein [Escherichia coli]MBC0763678.1 DUF551 domain-containing protein [Escherichia coli]MDN1139427.1 DUF551 domain-containing protein [Escherichia coli]
MRTFTDKELIKEIKERIGSLDVRDDIERRAYEIALASLEAEPVAWKTTFTQIGHECNTYTVTYFDKAEAERWVHIHNITGEFRAEVVPFYTAPPVSIVQLPFEQWLEQQREKIEVDCGCVSTETLMHWMRVAYEAGNSPVTPDSWISCSEQMPNEEDVLVYCSDTKEQMVGFHKGKGLFQFFYMNGVEGVCEPSHWMPLPEPPL